MFAGFAVGQDGPNSFRTTRNGWKALQSGCNSTIFGQTIHLHKGIHILDDSLDGQARAFEHDGAGHLSFDGFQEIAPQPFIRGHMVSLRRSFIASSLTYGRNISHQSLLEMEERWRDGIHLLQRFWEVRIVFPYPPGPFNARRPGAWMDRLCYQTHSERRANPAPRVK